jgi:hypothetical protein
MRKNILLSCSSVLYLTLHFSIAASGQTGATIPQDSEVKADPAAYSMFRDACRARYYFPKNFAGFTADIVANDNGKVARGAIYYDVNGSADLDMKDDPGFTEAWAVESIAHTIGHRVGEDFCQEYGRYPLTFGKDDHSPMGRQVLFNDLQKSSYRIRDGRITEVERTINNERRIITILEEEPVGEGRFLPHHFTVSYFDAKSQDLKRTEAYTEEYKQVDDIWFLSWKRITRVEPGKTIMRTIEFYKPRIRFARPAR